MEVSHRNIQTPAEHLTVAFRTTYMTDRWQGAHRVGSSSEVGDSRRRALWIKAASVGGLMRMPVQMFVDELRGPKPLVPIGASSTQSPPKAKRHEFFRRDGLH